MFFPFFLHLPFSLRFSLLFSYSYENFEPYCGISRYFCCLSFHFFFCWIFMNETYIRYKNILHIFLFLYISPVYFFFTHAFSYSKQQKAHRKRESDDFLTQKSDEYFSISFCAAISLAVLSLVFPFLRHFFHV